MDISYTSEKEACLFSPVYNQLIKGKVDYIYNNSIITNQIFDFEVCKTALEYALPNSDIIDIGANIGLVTLGIKRLLEINNSNNYINNFHCFECNNDVFNYLKYNTMEHNDIILYNFGLSDTSQIANMEINNYNNGCSTIKQIYNNSSNNMDILDYGVVKFNNITIQKNIFVSLMPLDLFINLFEKKVSVIKIDVEGMEYNVLLGAKKLIEKHKPTIIVEIFDINLIKVNELMTSYNYENKGLIPKKYKSQDYLFTYKF